MIKNISPRVGDVAHIEGDRFIVAEVSDTLVSLLDENYDRLLWNIADLDENHSKKATKKAEPQNQYEKDMIEELIIQDIEDRWDHGAETSSDIEFLLDVIDKYRSTIDI